MKTGGLDVRQMRSQPVRVCVTSKDKCLLLGLILRHLVSQVNKDEHEGGSIKGGGLTRLHLLVLIVRSVITSYPYSSYIHTQTHSCEGLTTLCDTSTTRPPVPLAAACHTGSASITLHTLAYTHRKDGGMLRPFLTAVRQHEHDQICTCSHFSP